MNRRLAMSSLVLLSLLFAACTTSNTLTDESKLGTLASSLGLSTQQAQGALGSMLVVAQLRLANDDYLRVVKYIPGADEYVGVARRLSLFEQASSAGTALPAAFTKLGLTPAQQAKFTEAVTDYLTKTGGPDVANLMKGALR